MRPQKLAILKLSKRAQELQELHEQLLAEKLQLTNKLATLEELLLQRNLLLDVLERMPQSDAIDTSTATKHARQQQHLLSLAGNGQFDHLLQQLPAQHAALSTIDQQLYESVKALTPAAAADFWLEQVRGVALLWQLHKRDPAGTQPALAAITAECMSWCNAVHIFNPRIMYALHDYNLVTRRFEECDVAAVKSSLARASGTLAPEQLTRIQSLLSIVQPRLEQLEQEKQQLLAAIERLDEQFSNACAEETCSAALGGLSSSDVTEGTTSGSSGGSSSLSSSSCASAGTSNSTASSNQSDSSESLLHAASLLRQREELLQRLDRNCTAWRVTSQMRGQWLTAKLTAPQAAKVILSCFPATPLYMDAAMFDIAQVHSCEQQRLPAEAGAAASSTPSNALATASK